MKSRKEVRSSGSDKKLCDDDDNQPPSKKGYAVQRSLGAQDEEICLLCGGSGKNGEWWFRCTSCSEWVHKACSGVSKPVGYVCDMCK